MTSGDVPFLPHPVGSDLDMEWKCPEKKCPHIELGKADYPLGNGVCDIHPNRALVRHRPHG